MATTRTPAPTAAPAGPSSSASSVPDTNGNGAHADAGEIQLIRLDRLIPSPTNPRKTFDEASLEELAKSIVEIGVLQPILVRAIPALRRQSADGVPPYEIIAGERRYRAAKAAQLRVLPAIVRNLDDKTVREIQLIENLQRSDLTCLEEAEGFRQLIAAHGYTADTLAQKIGKAKTYVYSLLKLADLPEKAKQAVAAGTWSKSVAQLVARIPSAKLREDATKFFLPAGKGDQQEWHYREVRDEIAHKYMVELKQAPFPQADPHLTPSGPCTTCPKRTGNNRAEFPEGRADVCTDPECYEAKVAAHTARTMALAKEAGQKVLPAAEAKKVFPYSHSDQVSYSSDYVALDDRNWADPQSRTHRQLAKPRPDVLGHVVLAVDPKGVVRELLPKEQAKKLVKKSANSRPADNWERKRREEQRVKNEVAKRLMAAVADKAAVEVAKLDSSRIHTGLFRRIAQGVLNSHWHDLHGAIAKRRDLDAADARAALMLAIGDMDTPAVIGLLCEFVAGQLSYEKGYQLARGGRVARARWFPAGRQ